MRLTVAPATASLALGCAGCEAFHVPIASSRTRNSQCCLESSSLSGVQGVRGVPAMEATATTQSSILEGASGETASSVSSYPGPVVPRVGSAMPKQRPGWFRVPAPGGKHTKVWIYCSPSCA